MFILDDIGIPLPDCSSSQASTTYNPSQYYGSPSVGTTNSYIGNVVEPDESESGESGSGDDESGSGEEGSGTSDSADGGNGDSSNHNYCDEDPSTS